MRRSGLLVVVAALVAGWPVAGSAGSADEVRQSRPAPEQPERTVHASLIGLPTDMEVLGLADNAVVGSVLVAGGDRHAAVVDLSSSPLVARDLGTLGGTYSAATAVHGSLVVGESLTADGRSHVFVVDLSAPSPMMRDLGSVPGAAIWSVDEVNDRWAVGTTIRKDRSTTEGNAVGLFVADLAAPQPQLKDVGTLGRSKQVEVTALDGGVVVGNYLDHRDTTWAFAYDAASAQPHFVRLGSLAHGKYRNRVGSDVADVSGHTIVGTTVVPRHEWRREAFVYDLGTNHMRALGRRTISASAIDGSVVVGAFIPKGADLDDWSNRHAFAYDLATPSAGLHDLGTLGRWSDADDIDGNFVVGTADRADQDVGVAYDLTAPGQGPVELGECDAAYPSYAVSGPDVLTPDGCVLQLGYSSAPAFSLGRLRQDASENAGTITVDVQRGGDTTVAASVDYRTRSTPNPNQHYRARAGRDYHPVTGRLDFAPGEISKTVTVHVRDDAKPEPYECFTLQLLAPSANAIIGTPSQTEIVITPSDTPPDLVIGPAPSDVFWKVPTGYLGNNVYNDTGADQTVTKTVSPGQTVNFYVRLYNDGRSGTAALFTLHATQPRPLRVRYHLGPRDVTAELRSRRGLTVRVGDREEYDIYRSMRVSLTPLRGAPAGDLASTLTATWEGDRVRTDAVTAVAHISS